MPEVKNAFIKSKMNKDLDARLMPSGEYRDAVNISISKSEGADVGAVENILGTEEIANLITASGVNPNSGLDIIGYCLNEAANKIYIFCTNQNINAGETGSFHDDNFIYEYDFSGNGLLTKLVQGAFLDFDKGSLITAAHILEDLLFFTDNRNQPRVINIEKAKNSITHYTTEDNISVAKFAPYEAISFYNDSTFTYTGANTTNANTFNMSASLNIKTGDIVLDDGAFIGKVRSYNSSTSPFTVTLDRIASIAQNSVLTFKRTSMVNKTQEHLDEFNKSSTGSIDNPYYDPNWTGDSDFLEDKFIRFSYRFRFENNEYSILAPFTQPIFIPKQFGYFMGDDENQTFKTSVVNFFENFVQEATLRIPLPSRNPVSDFKIKEIDILYKESDALTVKVMSTISSATITSGKQIDDRGSHYEFNYTSKKPYKTLAEKEIVRVFDKVPVKAQSQEIISNRVVYGNYVDKKSPPSQLPNYFVTSGIKLPTNNYASEYPTHTLKQNRTYQVGIILSDRYGRSTSVLLSKIDDSTGGAGSTIFHPYQSSTLNVEDWNGDAMYFNLGEPISEVPNDSISYPGFYANSNDGSKSWDINGKTVSKTTSPTFTYTINANITSSVQAGDYLRGKYNDYVKVIAAIFNSGNTIVTVDEEVADAYVQADSNNTTSDLRFAYTLNKLGWYSYKIVVKQQEQEYYNVYLPLVINGAYGAASSGGDIDSLAQAVLINDNINKVPRDLEEVGPDQKQYGSSVRLFGRVAPARANIATQNEQYFPNISSDQVSTIASATDSGYNTGNAIAGMYKAESNPLIATISSLAESGTSQSFGRLPNIGNAPPQNLCIYETNPTISLLDIYYETSTSGLLSDLNQNARNLFLGITGVDPITYTFSFNENQAASSGSPVNITPATGFLLRNAAGPVVSSSPNNPTVTATLVSVEDGDGNTLPATAFDLVAGTQNPQHSFTLRAKESRTFLQDVNSRTFTFTYNVTYNDSTLSSAVSSTITSTGVLSNATPALTAATVATTSNQSATSILNLSDFVNNGTAKAGETKLQLIYNEISEVDTITSAATTHLSVNPTTGEVTKNGIVPAELTLITTATDANGIGNTSPQQTHNISFGTPPNNLGSSFTFQSSSGFCDNTQSRFFALYISSPIGSGGNPAVLPTNTIQGTAFPSAIVASNPSNTNCFRIPYSGAGLTRGHVRFTLALNSPSSSCNSSIGQMQLRCWVQYRSGNSGNFTTATAISGGDLNGTGNGSINLILGSGTTSVFRDYAALGEYRVLIEYKGAQCQCNTNNFTLTISDPNPLP